MHCKNNILHISYDYGSNKKGAVNLYPKSKPGLLPAATTNSDPDNYRDNRKKGGEVTKIRK